MKQKWVLIRPNHDGSKAEFFQAVATYSSLDGVRQAVLTTDLLSEAEVLDQCEDTIKYMLRTFSALRGFEAVRVEDIDIFKAKLAGK
jgi:hypothetical protein